MIIIKESGAYLRNKYKGNRNIAIALGGAGSLVLALGFLLSQPIGIFFGIGFMLIGTPFMKKAFSYSSGIQGERAVEQELQDLDDSYFLINDVMIGDSGGNIDHILLSSKGIFIIETKNYSGDIRCNRDQWKKKVRYRLYEMISVSNQAKNNARCLSNIIRKKANQTIYIQPICVFTNPSARLRLYEPTLPVLRVVELSEFIRQFHSVTSLSGSEIQAISRCILWEHSENPG